MKITFVLPGYCLRPVGGAGVVYEYANHLTERGHEVCVVHPRFVANRQHNLFRWILAQGARLYKFFSFKKRKWIKINALVKMLYVSDLSEKNIPKSDVIVATAWHTAEYISNYSLSKGRKYYLIQHFEAWGVPEKRVINTWEGPFKLILISKWLLNKAINLGIEKKNIAYIPNGFNHEKFKVINPIQNREKCISMMYHRLSWKGSFDGIAALEYVKKIYVELKVIFFGRDVRPLGLPRWIEYKQNLSTDELVRQVFNKSSIFLFPSWGEGSPMPPLEAMACGCALVSTNCTGVNEYVKHEENALLSPVRDVESLQANIIRLLSDDNLRMSIAQNGYKSVQRRNWNYSTDLLEKFIST